MWNGLTPGEKPTYEELASVAALRAFADELEQKRQAFLNSLNDDKLQRPLSYTDMAGKRVALPLVQQMQHVVNHGTYHRGQVTTLLRQAGGETVPLDMSYFFREQSGKSGAGGMRRSPAVNVFLRSLQGTESVGRPSPAPIATPTKDGGMEHLLKDHRHLAIPHLDFA